MTFNDFLIFVAPELTLVILVTTLILWGAKGNTDPK